MQVPFIKILSLQLLESYIDTFSNKSKDTALITCQVIKMWLLRSIFGHSRLSPHENRERNRHKVPPKRQTPFPIAPCRGANLCHPQLFLLRVAHGGQV